MGNASHLDKHVPKEVRETVTTAKQKEMLGWDYPYKKKLGRLEYEEQKLELQIELLRMQNWVAETGEKIVLLFEGRDAGGKGGTVSRFMEHLNPRGARVVALQKPTIEERGQWYFQRYINHLPTNGEIVFFDRSWYNRAVVEPVMGFLYRGGAKGLPGAGPAVREDAAPKRNPVVQILVFGESTGTVPALQIP